MASNELFDTGIKVTGSFSAAGSFPVDGKYVVNTIAERDDHVTQNRAYDGMQVYVKQDETIYKYRQSDNTWIVVHNQEAYDSIYKHAVTEKGQAFGEADSDDATSILPGLYKFKTNEAGHVISVEKVTKEDIKALGIEITDTNTTYGDATETSSGLMSAESFKKLKGIEEGANKYTHPSFESKESGLYKIEVEGGHVKSVVAVTKADITELGIPGENTTYSVGGSSLGLVKNGGNVTINKDGTMTAPESSSNARAFIAECGVTTWEELEAAVSAGQIVSSRYQGEDSDVIILGQIASQSPNYIAFTSVDIDGIHQFVCDRLGGWSYTHREFSQGTGSSVVLTDNSGRILVDNHRITLRGNNSQT